MREILFRGKCVGEDHIYEWVDGYYVCMRDSYKKRETHRIYTGYAESDCGDFYGDWYEVDPKTVGQFTGLLDIDGQRIFEGDIVEIVGEAKEMITEEEQKFIVKWQDEDCGFKFFCWFDYKVVGNIYDNPEVLE